MLVPTRSLGEQTQRTGVPPRGTPALVSVGAIPSSSSRTDRRKRKEAAVTSTPVPKPAGDHMLTRADGRRVAWSEWGKAAGSAVLLLHRNPGSRLFDPDPAATAAAGVRLITLDRPGYGRSDPVVDPTRAAVASDVAAVVDDLGTDEIALVGWSGGGVFALEAAAALGNHARSLSLVCTPAPDEEIPWVPDEFRPLVESVPSDPTGALVAITAACAFYADDPEAVVASDPGPADADLRSRPGVTDRLAAMMREGARQGAIGMASDIVAGSRREPLPLGDVQAPVRLWYGDADWVGAEHGRWYAERLVDARLTIVPGAGHLLPLANWSAIVAAAVAP
jgi:pimeloyl-ACP methyl ester carboxylesterase